MQISPLMLVHTCTIYSVTGRDEDRKPTWSEAQTLSKVWLSFSNGMVNGSYGAETSDDMVLYFDCENSSAPSGFQFAKGQKVTFEGEDYTVENIKPCYGLKGLEHYEVTLK